MDQTAQEVEDLLSTESPTLYKHLVEILGSKFKDDHDTHSQFHVHLKKIIHVHLQRMFVGMYLHYNGTIHVLFHTIQFYDSLGDLPMEVVCYIWDQCFIGATISGFQCLKYFAASWFIILKHQLLVCQSVSPCTRGIINYGI